MTRLRIFLAPLALLLMGASAKPADSVAPNRRDQSATLGWQPPMLRQVRIEQHFSVRITPGIAVMPPWVVEQLEQESRIEHGDNRKIGKCLGLASIAALRPGDDDELLLFLHDDRVVSATLEKHCNARDFYAGFYIEPNSDGAICAGRDILQSRSGANCKVRRLHELVPAKYRRFP